MVTKKTRPLSATDRNKILILGGSSYIGRHLFARLGPDRAIATYHTRPIDHGFHFDTLTMNLSEIIKKPETISHAVILLADTNPETCAADLQKSNALNVESIKEIIKYLIRWKIKPIFPSTQFVFDGIKGEYVETDPVNPVLTYGRQKVEIEQYIQAVCEDYVIVRLEKVFGSEPGDKTLFDSWLDAIEQDRTIRCAQDQILSPIYIEDVVEGFLRLIKMNCNGIFHFGSHKPFNRLELFEMLLNQVRTYSRVNVKVVPCSIHDFDLREKRPLDVSVNPDKLVKTTGLKLRDVESVCREIVKNRFQSKVGSSGS